MTEFEKFAMNNFLIYGKNLVRIEDVERFYNEYRTTKRALWLARAVSAFHISENKESYDDYCDIQCERHNTLKFIPLVSESEWYKRWEKAERKCREKAEEYK